MVDERPKPGDACFKKDCVLKPFRRVWWVCRGWFKNEEEGHMHGLSPFWTCAAHEPELPELLKEPRNISSILHACKSVGMTWEGGTEISFLATTEEELRRAAEGLGVRLTTEKHAGVEIVRPLAPEDN